MLPASSPLDLSRARRRGLDQVARAREVPAIGEPGTTRRHAEHRVQLQRIHRVHRVGVERPGIERHARQRELLLGEVAPAIAMPIGVVGSVSVPRFDVTSRPVPPAHTEPVVSTIAPRSTFGVMRTVNSPESLAGFESAFATDAVISAIAAVAITAIILPVFIFVFMSYLLASILEAHAGHGRHGHGERLLPARRRQGRRGRAQPQLARRRGQHVVDIRVLGVGSQQLVDVVGVARLVALDLSPRASPRS